MRKFIDTLVLLTLLLGPAIILSSFQPTTTPTLGESAPKEMKADKVVVDLDQMSYNYIP